MMKNYPKAILTMASAVLITSSSTHSTGNNTTDPISSIPRLMHFQTNLYPSEKQTTSAPPVFNYFPTFGYYTVPFTKRSRLLVFPTDINKVLDHDFQKDKLSLNILPETHSQSVRARFIFKKIVDVLDKALVEDCPKYLDGINWEICVVDDPNEGGAASTGGKIFISLKSMENMETDAEVAVVIGHEVAHVVAGHHYDAFIREVHPYWFIHSSFCSILSKIIPIPYMVNKLKDLPFSTLRMYELEADRIAAMLMALAGYDPRTTILCFQKTMGCGDPDKELAYERQDDSLRTHPSGKRRELMLYQIMGEAASLYEHVIASYQLHSAQVDASALSNHIKQIEDKNLSKFT